MSVVKFKQKSKYFNPVAMASILRTNLVVKQWEKVKAGHKKLIGDFNNPGNT